MGVCAFTAGRRQPDCKGKRTVSVIQTSIQTTTQRAFLQERAGLLAVLIANWACHHNLHRTEWQRERSVPGPTVDVPVRVGRPAQLSLLYPTLAALPTCAWRLPFRMSRAARAIRSAIIVSRKRRFLQGCIACTSGG